MSEPWQGLGHVTVLLVLAGAASPSAGKEARGLLNCSFKKYLAVSLHWLFWYSYVFYLVLI